MAWLAALLALAATGAIVLVIALGNGDSVDVATPVATPAPAAQSGPSESRVAAAVGSRATVGPDEAGIAASITDRRPQAAASGPDEAGIAASITDKRPQTAASGPSESRVAASISGR